MQLTDYENAAFVVFIVLVTRVILAFDLNLYIPLSQGETAGLYAQFYISCFVLLTGVRLHMSFKHGDKLHCSTLCEHM